MSARHAQWEKLRAARGVHLHLSRSIFFDALEVRAHDGQDAQVGSLVAEYRGVAGLPVMQVSAVEVLELHMGIGTLLYEAAAMLAWATWRRALASGYVRTDDSEGFWEKQYKADRARRYWVEQPLGDSSVYILNTPPPTALDGMKVR